MTTWERKQRLTLWRVTHGCRNNGGRTGRQVDNRAKRREQRRNGTR